LQGVSSDTRIVLITPPPLHEEGRLAFQREMYGDEATGILERTNEVTRQYAEVVVGIGQTAGLPVVDLFTRLREDYGDCSDILEDGLHFNPTGQVAVWEHLKETILARFPEMTSLGQGFFSANSKSLRVDTPWHDEIDPAEPKATFAKWAAAPRDSFFAP